MLSNFEIEKTATIVRILEYRSKNNNFKPLEQLDKALRAQTPFATELDVAE